MNRLHILCALLTIILLGASAYFYFLYSGTLMDFSGENVTENTIAISEPETESGLISHNRVEPYVPISPTAVRNGDLTVVTDPEVGIVFEYPADWGPLSVKDERGTCSGQVAKSDPCNQRTYSFDQIAGGIFMSAQTGLSRNYPVGRGPYWGDSAAKLTSEFIYGPYPPGSVSLWKSGSTLMISNSGLSIRKLIDTNYITSGDEPGRVVTFYHLSQPERPYQGILLTQERLTDDTNSNIGRLFEEVLVKSLKEIPTN
ncbi:MAG: hypothetical protein QG636_382 [Patescibacteria group bacterium]|jgi:hypothetical protein|nr:hypothetical protein [Patescibacteria group bacterium]